MRYERLSIDKGNKKFLYGLIVGVALIIVINFFMSYAKYKVVDSVKLASGTVNYTAADFNIIAMYKNEGNKEEEIEEIPQTGYIINNNKSYCKEPGSEEEKRNILNYENGILSVNFSKKGTKCYLYFEKELLLKDEILEDNSNHSNIGTSFTGVATDSGLFEAADDYGTTYYYRGTVDNNWVKFGKTKDGQDIYWRIIRINGNGTIRLIYSGTGSAQSTGTGTQITTKAFNNNKYDSKYVGYMYGITSESYTETHKNETNSMILGEIVNWYNGIDGTKDQNNKTLDYSSLGFDATKYGSYLDGTTGFCNDRQIRKDNTKWWDSEDSTLSNLGWGTHITAYGPFHRIFDTSGNWNKTQTPTFTCENKMNDLFTTINNVVQGNRKLPVPVGLITSDEVIFAGGFGGSDNTNYWLYTGSAYWTMSPYGMSQYGGCIFRVTEKGYIAYNEVGDTYGVRPVVNLKANAKYFTEKEEDKGTINNPYIIQ